MTSPNHNLPLITLRRARLTDIYRLWKWRNEPSTRLWSRSSNHIRFRTHLGWFLANQSNPSIAILVVLDARGRPAGTVRFNLAGDGIWTTSITLASKFRGKHIGVTALISAEEVLRNRNDVFGFRALINPQNHASVGLFERVGYKPTGIENGKLLEFGKSV